MGVDEVDERDRGGSTSQPLKIPHHTHRHRLTTPSTPPPPPHSLDLDLDPPPENRIASPWALAGAARSKQHRGEEQVGARGHCLHPPELP